MRYTVPKIPDGTWLHIHFSDLDSECIPNAKKLFETAHVIIPEIFGWDSGLEEDLDLVAGGYAVPTGSLVEHTNNPCFMKSLSDGLYFAKTNARVVLVDELRDSAVFRQLKDSQDELRSFERGILRSDPELRFVDALKSYQRLHEAICRHSFERMNNMLQRMDEAIRRYLPSTFDASKGFRLVIMMLNISNQDVVPPLTLAAETAQNAGLSTGRDDCVDPAICAVRKEYSTTGNVSELAVARELAETIMLHQRWHASTHPPKQLWDNIRVEAQQMQLEQIRSFYEQLPYPRF